MALRLYARYCGQHDALAQAKAFEALLRRELDVEPEPETQALVEEIRKGDIARVPAAAIGEPIVVSAGDAADAISKPSSPNGTEAGDGVEQSSLAHQADATRRWWEPRGGWSGRSIAAGAAIAILALFGGVLALMPGGAGRLGSNDVLDKKPVAAAAIAADPWRSPRLPSQRADVAAGRGGGLVAIAVLPFTSAGEGGEPSNIAAEMMTDDLTDTLSRMAVFRVISRQTARSYRGQRVDASTIGAELGVRYLLEGSVSTGGNVLRVNVDLIETNSRRHVWSGRFERAGADRHVIQDEIVNSLGRELQIEVTRLESYPGSNAPDVHELIFKGSAALSEAAKSGLDRAAAGGDVLYAGAGARSGQPAGAGRARRLSCSDGRATLRARSRAASGEGRGDPATGDRPAPELCRTLFFHGLARHRARPSGGRGAMVRAIDRGQSQPRFGLRPTRPSYGGSGASGGGAPTHSLRHAAQSARPAPVVLARLCRRRRVGAQALRESDRVSRPGDRSPPQPTAHPAGARRRPCPGRQCGRSTSAARAGAKDATAPVRR